MSSSTAPTESFIRRTLTVVAIGTAVILLFLFIWQILDVLVLLFAGILLGVLLTSVSGWLRERTPLSHKQSLAVVIILLLIIIVGGGWLVAPSLVNQAEQLSNDLVTSFEDLRNTLQDQSWAQPILNRLPSVDEISSSGGLLSRVSGLFSRTFNMFTDVIIILFIGLYLAIDPDLYANGFIKLAPISRRHRLGQVLDEVAYALRWWLAGRLASMVVVGVLSIIGLMILGVPLPFILGLLTGLLAFVPIVGPTLALFPPSLIAFTISPTKALYVILLYLGIQFVESYFITPIIQQRTVSLPPVLLLTSQVVFSLFFSFIGLAVAAPFAAMAMVLTKMLYLQDVLNDENVELLKENPEAHFEASQEAADSANLRTS